MKKILGKSMANKLTILVSVFCLLFAAMTGCGQKSDTETDVTGAISSEDMDVTVRVGSLKGPTSIGLVSLMENSANGTATGNYEFTMETAADVFLASMVSGNLDIALVPANMASIMYNKTEGGICVIDINTLGVLYAVSGDTSITDMNGLKGKTIYLTGKGTTPDYVLQYLLGGYGVDLSEVKLEYKSEAQEVVAMLKEDSEAVGILPQPFVTVATLNNENLNVVLDTTMLWDELQKENGSRLVTGVTVVRKEFLEQHRTAVERFCVEHKASAEFANSDAQAAALLVEKYGIIEKAAVAQKAIPECNITYMDGDEMKNALSGYLEVLANFDMTAVGGSLPSEDFYFNK